MTKIDPACVLCDAAITPANDSAEHVLPNAIGCRVKVLGVLCKTCNDRTGHTWDAMLSRELQGLALLIGVDRERGDTPPMVVTTAEGQALRMTARDGLFLAKPTFEVVDTEAGLQLRLSARTMNEARAMIEGAKSRYPNIDVEAALAQVRHGWARPQGYMQHSFGIGSPAALRSIVKSALVFALRAGLPRMACGPAISFLRGPESLTPPLGWYYQTDPIAARPLHKPVTCVAVHARPETGLVLGYVEYFGLHRAVIELGRDYHGPEVCTAHGFDPRDAQVLPLSITLPFDRAELQATYEYERIPEGAMEAALAQVLPHALQRQIEDEQKRVFGAAVQYALERVGLQPGDEISPEHAQTLARLVTEYLTPWIAQDLARRRALSRPDQPVNRRVRG